MIAIRQVSTAEWKQYKTLRLKALLNDGQFFGSNFTLESGYDDATWQSHLENPNTGIFILADNGMPIGLTGVATDRGVPDNTQAYLWGSWLEPAYRKRGLSKLMYEARISWCKAHPTINRVFVSHRASNHASKAANQKFGFQYTETRSKLWPDGVTEDEVCYILPIK